MSAELCPGVAVEVRQVWAAGLPPAWVAGYRFRGRCVYPLVGEKLVVEVEVASGIFAGVFLNYDEADVRAVDADPACGQWRRAVERNR